MEHTPFYETAAFETLVEHLTHALVAPMKVREKYRGRLEDVLRQRADRIRELIGAGVAGAGSVAAGMFAAELARIEFTRQQLPHLDSGAVLYTLGVFELDGRPGDYMNVPLPAAGPTIVEV